MKVNFLKVRSCVVFLIAMPFMLFCGKTIPVEELSQAKYEIARAEGVKADKYAQEKFAAAQKSLLAAHEQVEKEDMKEAKKLAEEAATLAKEAFAVAAPQLAQDTRVEADNAIRAANDAYAEEFAPTEYQNAKAAFAAGDDYFARQEYVDSFRKFEESREEANKALTISEAQTENMRRQVAEIENRIREAESYGANEAAPDTMQRARESTALAKQRLAEKRLKLAAGNIQTARESAELATKLARKEWARKKFLEAETAVATAERNMIQLRSAAENEQGKRALETSPEAQDFLAAAEDTLEAAKESLRKAEAEYKNENYSVSYNHSEEAIRLSRIVNEQIPQVEVALTRAVHRQAEQSEEEEKDTTKPGTSSEEGKVREGWKKYKVRLIPHRRDCLWRIAEYKFIYNNPFLWPKIYRANKHQIKNPDLIYPGQVFDIPPKDSTDEQKPREKKQPTTKTKEPKATKQSQEQEKIEFVDEKEQPVVPSYEEYEEEEE